MRDALEVLKNFGMFDVLLPFLLVFVLVFALVEKTKIFGTEKDGESKKNINSLFAFTIALFAVTSSWFVGRLNSLIGPIMILLLCLVLFIMLVSVFEPEGGQTNFGKAKWFFASFIGVVMFLVFLGSVENKNGDSWLRYGWNWILRYGDSGFVSAIVLLLIIAGIVAWVSKGSGKGGSE